MDIMHSDTFLIMSEHEDCKWKSVKPLSDFLMTEPCIIYKIKPLLKKFNEQQSRIVKTVGFRNAYMW